MGISGLLPFLKEASTNANIKQFEGATVAVDTYCWIYRGAFSCAEQLALGQPADGHVKYVLKYVHKLQEWGIKPIMIFDGSCLPSKKGTELKRKESKEMYRKKAAQCLAEGRKNEAREYFQRCIECTPKMALEALQNLGVDILVAPYEADAQLAYLNKIDVAQIIITEDSDLILFGCEKIMYKLDINGFGQLVQKEKIISITQFDSADNFERFRWMCILSGCDYLENLPGIGLGKAKKLLKSITKSDIDYIVKQMPKVLKMPNLIITNEYIENFKKADKTFKYQIVFDPLKRKLVSLHAYGPEIEPNEDVSYAGFFYDQDLSIQHSLGNIDVNTREKVNDFNPDNWNYKPPAKYANNPPAHMKSIWSKSYKTFKNSNPFSKFMAKKEPVNLPNTNGMSKTISSKPLLDDNFVNKNKRKLQALEKNETALEKIDSDEGKENNKRIKMNDIRVDLDCLLDDYSSAKCNNIEIESSNESSGYFSSNASNKLGSPIINRPSQLLNRLSQDEENKSPKQCTASILESLETDFNYEKKFTLEALNSPIVTDKSFNSDDNSQRKLKISESSNLLSKFSAKKINKFSKDVIEKDEIDDIVAIVEEKIEVNSEFNSSNKETTKLIIEDIDRLGPSSGKVLNKSSQNIKTKKGTNKVRNQAEQSNIRPISDFFKNFEYTKSSLKFSK
ncbi:exonuclease 1-like [Brachionus plicatilis]|uniref:Exonuclease 1 n=1 Tax=Brachionus plicatilis TaxID=10195 RepID=A0A3M7SXG6_BRAPC|nr:exonuclease 1-like [Brachionus plicatilis]